VQILQLLTLFREGTLRVIHIDVQIQKKDVIVTVKKLVEDKYLK